MKRCITDKETWIVRLMFLLLIVQFCMHSDISEAKVKVKVKVKEQQASVLKKWRMVQPGSEYICIEVQGSTNSKSLLRQFDRMKKYDDVRIEKDEEGFLLLVGFYNNQNEAEETLKAIKRNFRKARPKTCAYDSSRIVRMRSRPVTIIEDAELEKTAANAQQENALIESKTQVISASPLSREGVVEQKTDTKAQPPETKLQESITPGGRTPGQLRKNVIESGYMHENLSDKYGTWDTLNLKYTRKETGYTYFFEIAGFARQEKNASLFSAGIYKDWLDWLYTYSSASMGTVSDYLPSIRVDHDFNFKFGERRNFVWTVGGSIIDYHVDHRDYIISTGLAAYLGKFVGSYRLFRNISMPGSVGSFSHTFALEYGEVGNTWTSLIYSFGYQAYRATNLASPTDVSNDSQSLTLRHRHWIKDGYGVFGETSYFNLENGYKKYGLGFGVFKEF